MRRFFICTLFTCCAVGCGPDATLQSEPDVFFFDSFEGSELESGWTILRPDDANLNLDERPGFLRIRTQAGIFGKEGTARNLVLRGIIGNFQITTHVEFDYEFDRQLAGIIVRGDDGRGVLLGLTQATGERGVFRGVVVLADGGPEVEVDRAGALYAFADIFLRLERDGNTFTASFSRTGNTYTIIGTVSTELSDGVSVGVGAADGDCGEDCDHDSIADFDFFEIALVSAVD